MYQESLVPDRLVNPDIPESMRGKNQVMPPRYFAGMAQRMLYPRAPVGDTEASVVHVHRGTGLLCLRLGRKFPFGLGIIGREYGVLSGPECFDKVDIVRWKRIISAIERIDGPILQPQPYAAISRQQLHQRQHLRYPGRHYHEAFSYLSGNIRPHKNPMLFLWSNAVPRVFYRQMLDPWELVKFISKAKLLFLLILTLPAVYGGIHLAAINFGFPSAVESLLWKVSSIYIMVALPTMMALSFFFRRWLYYMLDAPLDAIPEWVGYLGGLGILLGYVLARIFLVAESFASLRAEPIGVFWTPAWLQMIPHI